MAPVNKVEELFNVRGQVVVITGGGTGLGLYAARALDANGAKAVYIIGRREEALQNAASAATNGTIIPLVGDVSDKASLTRIVDQIKNEHGFINLLLANAGISGSSDRARLSPNPTVQEFRDALWNTEMQNYTDVLGTNCTGVYYTILAFLGLLDAGNKTHNVPQDSQIIVTGSVAGVSRHLAMSFAYATSKAAVGHLVKMLSTSFAQNQFRIRVNLIAPGLYPSEMTTSATDRMEKFEGGQGAFEGAYVMSNAESPAQRTGSEQDFVGTVLFMASPAGAYLNGVTLLTDGGRVSLLPAVY